MKELPSDTSAALMSNANHNLLVALSYGAIYATLMHSLARMSGGHINPAITISAVVARRITFSRGVLYIICQGVGGIAGAATLSAMTSGVSPTGKYGNLGVGELSTSFNTGQVFGAELLMCTFITMSWLFLVEPRKAPFGRFQESSGPLVMGMIYFVCAAFTIRWDNVGLNPVRAFGPSAVNGNWDNQWVYWMGPLMGGMLGALLHEFFEYMAPGTIEVPTSKIGVAGSRNQ